jgi:hypothetical protein
MRLLLGVLAAGVASHPQGQFCNEIQKLLGDDCKVAEADCLSAFCHVHSDGGSREVGICGSGAPSCLGPGVWCKYNQRTGYIVHAGYRTYA